MYEQQMIKMIIYKSTDVYPFEPMDVNKKRAFHKSAENYSYSNSVLQVKGILKKNDIGPNEGTFSICIHSILNIVKKKEKKTENNYNYLTSYILFKFCRSLG